MIERKKYGMTPLSASGKEKYISGAADFGALARYGHGFHTWPCHMYPQSSNQIGQYLKNAPLS